MGFPSTETAFLLLKQETVFNRQWNKPLQENCDGQALLEGKCLTVFLVTWMEIMYNLSIKKGIEKRSFDVSFVD